MHGFVEDIEDLAVKNTNFRRVLYTARHSQLGDTVNHQGPAE